MTLFRDTPTRQRLMILLLFQIHLHNETDDTVSDTPTDETDDTISDTPAAETDDTVSGDTPTDETDDIFQTHQLTMFNDTVSDTPSPIIVSKTKYTKE